MQFYNFRIAFTNIVEHNIFLDIPSKRKWRLADFTVCLLSHKYLHCVSNVVLISWKPS